MKKSILLLIAYLLYFECFAAYDELSPKSLIKDNNAIISVILSSDKPSPLAQKLKDENYLSNINSILSLGSGAGLDEELFSESENIQVLGTDVKDVFIKEADSKLNPNLNFKKLDVTQSFNLRGGFDLVYARNLLHYFKNDQLKHILKEVHKTLNNDGRFVFQLKSKDDHYYQSENVKRELREDGMVFFPEMGYSRNFLNSYEIKNLLSEAGFEIEEMYDSKERMYNDKHDSSLLVVFARKKENMKVNNTTFNRAS